MNTNHTLGGKENLSTFSNHNEMKLEINNIQKRSFYLEQNPQRTPGSKMKQIKIKTLYTSIYGMQLKQ